MCYLLHSDLPGVTQDDLTDTPLLFIDTAGHGLSELVTPDEESKGNEGLDFNIIKAKTQCYFLGEADLVLHHLKHLLGMGVCLSDIAVIAPYNLQVLSE